MREPFVCSRTLGTGRRGARDPAGRLPGGARSVLDPRQHLVVVAPKSSSGASLQEGYQGVETPASDIRGIEWLPA